MVITSFHEDDANRLPSSCSALSSLEDGPIIINKSIIVNPKYFDTNYYTYCFISCPHHNSLILQLSDLQKAKVLEDTDNNYSIISRNLPYDFNPELIILKPEYRIFLKYKYVKL